MRVAVALLLLAAVASALLDPKAREKAQVKADEERRVALEKVTPHEFKAIKKMYEEMEKSGRTADDKGPQRDGTVIKWHSMSEVRRLQSEGRKMVVVRIEPIDSKGLERRLEVVAAELRARGAEEAIWVKRTPPADDDQVWLRWENIPYSTEIFLLTAEPGESARMYKGADSFTELLTWLLEYLPPLKPRKIRTEEELDQFMLSAPVSLIAYVSKDLGVAGAFQEFVKKIAQRHPYLPVGLIYPAEELPYTKHTLSPISIYYRDEDHVFPLDEDRLLEMDDFTRDNALKKASHQFISRFPDDAAHIFSQGIDKIVFVFGDVGERRGQTPSYLRELALEMRQRVVIAYVDKNDERMAGVREFFGVSLGDAVRGFDSRTERQYWPARSQGVAFPHEVQSFVRDLAANKLSPYRKNEEIDPQLNEDGLNTLKLNADTFQSIALDPSVDTVVCFFATWCPHSKRFLAQFLSAADQNAKQQKKIVFAVLDVEKNDVETKNKIRTFPMVILFRKNTNEEVVYTGRRNVPAFLRWLFEEVEKKQSEESEEEVDETAKDYESPLKKMIKHDPEQQYTIDKLKHDPSTFEETKEENKKGGLDELLAEKVLAKLKVDRPDIAEALEKARLRGEEKAGKKKGAVEEERKKDTIDQKIDAVEERKMDTVQEKEHPPKEKAPESPAGAVEKPKMTVAAPNEVQDTVVDTPKENTADPNETKIPVKKLTPAKNEL